jgi:hypothetical protein
MFLAIWIRGGAQAFPPKSAAICTPQRLSRELEIVEDFKSQPAQNN